MDRVIEMVSYFKFNNGDILVFRYIVCIQDTPDGLRVYMQGIEKAFKVPSEYENEFRAAFDIYCLDTNK